MVTTEPRVARPDPAEVRVLEEITVVLVYLFRRRFKRELTAAVSVAAVEQVAAGHINVHWPAAKFLHVTERAALEQMVQLESSGQEQRENFLQLVSDKDKK